MQVTQNPKLKPVTPNVSTGVAKPSSSRGKDSEDVYKHSNQLKGADKK
jgi:hypothetical protein